MRRTMLQPGDYHADALALEVDSVIVIREKSGDQCCTECSWRNAKSQQGCKLNTQILLFGDTHGKLAPVFGIGLRGITNRSGECMKPGELDDMRMVLQSLGEMT